MFRVGPICILVRAAAKQQQGCRTAREALLHSRNDAPHAGTQPPPQPHADLPNATLHGAQRPSRIDRLASARRHLRTFPTNLRTPIPVLAHPLAHPLCAPPVHIFSVHTRAAASLLAPPLHTLLAYSVHLPLVVRPACLPCPCTTFQCTSFVHTLCRSSVYKLMVRPASLHSLLLHPLCAPSLYTTRAHIHGAPCLLAPSSHTLPVNPPLHTLAAHAWCAIVC